MSANFESLGTAVEALSRFFVGETTVRETLHQVAELACATVNSADMVGITLLVQGQPTTAAFTDHAALEVDAAQYESGMGPCLDASRHHQVFRVDDLEKDHQWPTFNQAAVDYGLASVLSVPLVAGHEGVGAVNFYSRSRAAFSDHDVQTALQFAAPAAIVLANSQAYWDAQRLGQNMEEAMRSRATVEQAKGILMAAQRCSADEAFQMLVRASERENRKLSEIADEIVSRTADGQA